MQEPFKEKSLRNMPSKVTRKKRSRKDVDEAGDVAHQQVAASEGAYNRNKDKILQMCRAGNKEVLVELKVKIPEDIRYTILAPSGQIYF